MNRFTEGNYLVTGASGGIGAATVRRLCAEEGLTVYASGRSEEKLASLAEETGCLTLPFDLTSEDDIRRAVADIEWYGIVNCGGDGGEIATPMETDIAVFDRVIAVNTRAPLLIIKYATPAMIEADRGGSIVNISSQASLMGLPGHISYGSSKAALDNITRVGALELGKYGIRVNSINPTVVMTDMSAAHWGAPGIAEVFLRSMPMHKWATEDDIAGPICFFLSNDAGMISGVSLAVDGGFVNGYCDFDTETFRDAALRGKAKAE